MAEIRPIRFQSKRGETFFIRSAHGKDAGPVLSCANQIIGERIYSITSPEEFLIGMEQEIEYLEEHRKDPSKLFLIVENEKKEVVGNLDFSSGRFLRQRHTGEFGMGVVQSARGQGIGEKILSVFLDWARTVPGLEKIKLTVHSDNLRAQELYKKMGFEVEGVGRRDTLFEMGHYVDSVHMAKFLK